MGLLTRADPPGTRLKDCRVLVVGGSGGIGRSVSYSLADEGAMVIVHGGSNQDRLHRVVRYINDRGGRARGVLQHLDVATDINPVLQDLGDIDVLVVSFGPIFYSSLGKTDAQAWNRVTDLNLNLPGLLVSYYLPKMIEQGWGRIVLFGGPRADRSCGFREAAAYNAAKAGVVSLCRSAAMQTDGANVSVNLVSPGYVDTEYLTQEERERGMGRSPRGALIPPERIARLVRDLVCSQEPDINGAVIPIDQGLS